MKKSNRLYLSLVAVCTFLSALIFECLTPLLSDDMPYMAEVARAESIGDVLQQEVVQYLGWTGRSVAHVILRLFFFCFHGRSAAFDVTAALVFTALTLLMLRLVRRDGETLPDWRLYLLLVLSFWFFAVKPGQTVFWMTGACNYLFTTTLILGFFALCERFFSEKERAACHALLLLIVGFLAGWCNENTSGAAVLNVLLLLLFPLWERRRGESAASAGRLPVKLAALCGVCGGFAMQLCSPGNRSRTALIEESHSGLLLYGARLLQILHELRSLFLPLFLTALFLLILAKRQGVAWERPGMRSALRYLLLCVAASLALLLAPSPQTRTYFGAGVFLLIACAQLFALTRWEGALMEAVRDFTVCALLLVFVLHYFEEGGNLARIRREENRRYELLSQVQAAGEEDGYVPMLPEGFDSPYSMAYDIDVHKEWYLFSNMQLANFYGLDTVSGIPYDEYYQEEAP